MKSFPWLSYLPFTRYFICYSQEDNTFFQFFPYESQCITTFLYGLWCQLHSFENNVLAWNVASLTERNTLTKLKYFLIYFFSQNKWAHLNDKNQNPKHQLSWENLCNLSHEELRSFQKIKNFELACIICGRLRKQMQCLDLIFDELFPMKWSNIESWGLSQVVLSIVSFLDVCCSESRSSFYPRQDQQQSTEDDLLYWWSIFLDQVKMRLK